MKIVLAVVLAAAFACASVAYAGNFAIFQINGTGGGGGGGCTGGKLDFSQACNSALLTGLLR